MFKGECPVEVVMVGLASSRDRETVSEPEEREKTRTLSS